MLDNLLKIQLPIKAEFAQSDEKAIKAMMDDLSTLIDAGALKGDISDILKDYEIDLESGYITVYLNNDCLVDGSQLNSVGGSKIFSDEDKTFSSSSIQERLRLSTSNPAVQFRYITQDYKRYYQSKLSLYKSKPELVTQLRDLFVNDLNGLFTKIVPLISAGKQLSSLIGVAQVSHSMSKSASNLSSIYSTMLKSEQTSGSISKTIYSRMKIAYSEFVSELLKVVFPGIEDILGKSDKSNDRIPKKLTNEPIEETKEPLNKETKSKTYSILTDGRINLFN
jgi:hypothetical protein